MTIALSCWLTWLIGIVKLFTKVRKLTSAPSVSPVAPLTASAPPTSAHSTYAT